MTGWAMMPLVEHDSLLLRLDFLADPAVRRLGAQRISRVYAVT